MKRGQEYIKEKTAELNSVIDRFKKINPQFNLVAKDKNQNILADEKQREINKEIIRRLRIQNKKLLEQVIKLKEETKKTRFNKSQVLNHINELLKLIKS